MRNPTKTSPKSNMGLSFLTLLVLLSGLWDAEAMTLTKTLGEDINIPCIHSNAYSNVKYFCKAECTDKDILISSRDKMKISKQKYSIIDKGNTFIVTIRSLKENDSGTYWCGIERVGLDTYNKVVLVVKPKQSNGNDNLESLSNIPRYLVYIAAGSGLGLVMLALALGLLKFFRHRNRNVCVSPGKGTDAVVDTSKVQHQDTSSNRKDNICSTVSASSESQNQPESLFYSTVCFNKQPDCSSVTPGPVTYATIKGRKTDK